MDARPASHAPPRAPNTTPRALRAWAFLTRAWPHLGAVAVASPAPSCHSRRVNFFKSRAFFRVRLVVYGAAIAYFGVQALRAYQAKATPSSAPTKATQSPSQAGGAGMRGTKKTVTLPNGETIEYMEYELTEAEAAKLQASGRFQPGDAPAPAPEAKPNPKPAPAPAPAPAPGN